MPISLPEPAATLFPPDLKNPLEGGLAVPSAAGEFKLLPLRLVDGPSRDVELLLVQTDRVRAAICPTRGMGLWKANIDGLALGWDSPVEGPVHPNYVPLAEESGLGWLDGFDELLVRCGLRSFGAPDVDSNGKLSFPLHGRIGNLPARNLSVEVDQEHSLLQIEAEVHEARFLQYNLRLKARYVFAMGEPSIRVQDQVQNASATPSSMQLLYHINIGEPVLGQNAEFVTAAQRCVARDAHAASDLKSWSGYRGPTPGYQEQVYFFNGTADDRGWAHALLSDANKRAGVAVSYKTDTLPFFSQWKNTVDRPDGYVTGLEPGTGFPNPRSFEEQKGRVVQLEPQQQVEFNVQIEGINNRQDLEAMRARIDQLGSDMPTAEFDEDWCIPR